MKAQSTEVQILQKIPLANPLRHPLTIALLFGIALLTLAPSVVKTFRWKDSEFRPHPEFMAAVRDLNKAAAKGIVTM